MHLPVRSMEAVGKAGAARKLASAAAYGGGGLSVLGAGLYGVLRAEAQLARRDDRRRRATSRRPTRPAGTAAAAPARRSRSRCSATPAPPGTASTGSRRPPARCSPAGSPSAPTGGSTCARSPSVGARSSDLDGQIDRALPIEPDVAVILIGVNDVTHRVRPAASVRHLAEAVRRLQGGRGRGRWSAPAPTSAPSSRSRRRSSRWPAPGRAGWPRRRPSRCSRSGGRTVSLGSILGPEFAAAPALLFGPDQFHPSAAGYRSLAAVLLPSMLAALGLIPDDEAAPEALRGEGVLPITDRRAAGGQHPRHRARRHRGRRRPPRRPRPLGRAAAPPPAPGSRGRGAGRRPRAERRPSSS